jgi:hypothetical protein
LSFTFESVVSDFPVAGVAELADALDSKFRNDRFNLVNCHQMPFLIFIGKSGVFASIALINESCSKKTRK